MRHLSVPLSYLKIFRMDYIMGTNGANYKIGCISLPIAFEHKKQVPQSTSNAIELVKGPLVVW